MELPPTSCFTVHVASWVPFKAAAPQGAFARVKTSSQGVWLRSSDPGALCVEVAPGAAQAQLSITLKGSVRLLECPVTAGGTLQCLALCPAHTGTGAWVLLLGLKSAERQALLSGTARPTAPVQPKAQPLQPGGQQHQQHPVDLKQQIQACLCDPEFMAYVDQVERIWEELEEELGLQEAS